jgi:tetratricopeptide (TPR) repeat protein
VLNKLGEFAQALERIEMAVANSPTATGWAIALAAQGEALCRLGRLTEGTQAFEAAIRAQPVIGSLNSADSMTRLKSSYFLEEAQRLVNDVLSRYNLQINPSLRAEAYTISGKIAVRRGDLRAAGDWFTQALKEDPGNADADLQVRLLRSATSG